MIRVFPTWPILPCVGLKETIASVARFLTFFAFLACMGAKTAQLSCPNDLTRTSKEHRKIYGNKKYMKLSTVTQIQNCPLLSDVFSCRLPQERQGTIGINFRGYLARPHAKEDFPKSKSAHPQCNLPLQHVAPTLFGLPVAIGMINTVKLKQETIQSQCANVCGNMVLYTH